VRPWAATRHIDINGDLHYFFDGLVAGKTVLDVGAGLGKSKVRIRHNRVTTMDPSPAVEGLMDVVGLPARTYDVVTAFEVVEHVPDDQAFLAACRACAEQAIFLTTPNWAISQCQSADHYREYTHAEWEELIVGAYPEAAHYWWGAAYKDAEGGYATLLSTRQFRQHQGRKHLVLVDFALNPEDRTALTTAERRGLLLAWAQGQL
jgi:hypothetical protein